jgi:hypothetical protein
MSVTIADHNTLFNTFVGDSSTDRISAAERLQYHTESILWLQEELGNEHQQVSSIINYIDTIHYYKIGTSLPDVINGVDLRRDETDQTYPFAFKSGRELAAEIATGATESSFGIERRDKTAYLVINHDSKYSASEVTALDSLTADGGTWEADTTNSDATNLTLDTVEYKQGTGSLNFDVDVSQSGNHRATIFNDGLDEQDLSDYEDIASFVFWVYITSVTNFSSVTFYWGSSDSAYWSATATTDTDGAAFVAGWNRVKINWADATATGTPDSSAIDYIRFDFNYTGSYLDQVAFRIDDLKIAQPEKLRFIYTSSYIGTDTSGTNISSFTATTDIPFFSGQYDGYKFACSHYAAALALDDLRLEKKADREFSKAISSLGRQRKLIPASKQVETKSFRPMGISFNKRRRR